jgi:hypothetical protein
MRILSAALATSPLAVTAPLFTSKLMS